MHKKQFKISLAMLAATIFTVLMLGAIIFSLLEGWSIVNSFYFVTMTATTVGYGDVVPTQTLTKLITIVYSLSIVPFVLYAFSIAAKYQIERVYKKIYGLERKQRLQEDEIEKTERKISAQRRRIRQQTETLTKQEDKLKEQARLNRKQGKELEEHEKEIKGAEKKIKKTAAEIKEQSEELKEHDKELEVVEDIVGAALAKKK